jgi:hypothetical protein
MLSGAGVPARDELLSGAGIPTRDLRLSGAGVSACDEPLSGAGVPACDEPLSGAGVPARDAAARPIRHSRAFFAFPWKLRVGRARNPGSELLPAVPG